MKIRKLNFYIMLFLSLFVLCSFRKNNNVTITGHIHVYGNEPFTYIGIKTEENNKEYKIEASAEINDILRLSQGKMIEINGRIIKSDKNEPGMLKDVKIEVYEWRVLK